MPSFPKHVFLCASVSGDKYPHGCCLAEGIAAIHNELELLLTQRGLAGKILINSVDCLAHCTRGGILGVYPDEVWYGYATFDDIRNSHRQGRFDPTPLCAECDDWHRP